MTVAPYVNGSGHLLGEPAVRNRYSEPDSEPCWHCHEPRRPGDPWALRQLCGRCYRRWSDHGFDGATPPAPRTTEQRWVVTDPVLLAEFARWDRPHIPGRTAELARRFNVSRKTLSRMRRRVAEHRARDAQETALALYALALVSAPSPASGGNSQGGKMPDAGAMVATEAHDQTTSSAQRCAYFRA